MSSALYCPMQNSVKRPSDDTPHFIWALIHGNSKMFSSELLSAATRAEQYLEDSSEKEKMSKDDFDNIHQIVGQTRLLCQDKLGKQFRNLCLKTLVRSSSNPEQGPSRFPWTSSGHLFFRVKLNEKMAKLLRPKWI